MCQISVGFIEWIQNQNGLISHSRVGREQKEEGLTEWHKAWAVLTGSSCFKPQRDFCFSSFISLLSPYVVLVTHFPSVLVNSEFIYGFSLLKSACFARQYCPLFKAFISIEVTKYWPSDRTSDVCKSCWYLKLPESVNTSKYLKSSLFKCSIGSDYQVIYRFQEYLQILSSSLHK